MATVWGDIAHTYEIMDGCLELLRGKVLQQESLIPESFGYVLGLPMMGSFAHHCNMPAEQRTKVAAFLSDFGGTWKAADDTMDTAASVFSGAIRPRGEKVKGQHWVSVEQLSLLTKCAWYLCAQDPGVSAAEVIASLPSIEEMIEMSPSPAADAFANFAFYHPLVNVACVWEKLGRPEDALQCATAALENESARCGTVAPHNRISAHLVQGRAQASLRHTQAAADAFKAAAELADKHGLRLFQALALKDLKLCVLDLLGHAEHGSRQLGETLRLLVGPADMLAPLMDGFNVVELMRLPAPSVEEIEYGGGEVATLQTELFCLGLKDLRKRAKAEGMSAAELEEAMDADDPEEILIGFVLDEKRRALESELAGLKLKALRQRARSCGVSEELLEDANDAEDIRGAVIELILDAASSMASRESEERRALEPELAGLKLKALRQRARSCGVSEELLEDTNDTEDIRGAVIELICATQHKSSVNSGVLQTDRSHFGKASAALPASIMAPTVK
eukprot:COSAG02_NODE_10511_length_1925_cov_1.674699_1_plen_507_part_10